MSLTILCTEGCKQSFLSWCIPIYGLDNPGNQPVFSNFRHETPLVSGTLPRLEISQQQQQRTLLKTESYKLGIYLPTNS